MDGQKKCVGIIAAMQLEAESLLWEMQDPVQTVVSGITFTTGELCGSPVVLAVSGEGKVNAALCAEAMILRFAPELLLNTGVAGTLSPEIGVGDIAIASDTVEHDYDCSPLGYERGYVFGVNTVHVPCDKEIVARLTDTVRRLGHRYAIGTVATGDQFIGDRAQKDAIRDAFGAIACEMEGGAIGHIACLNGVPFGIIRAISDSADGNAPESFEVFARRAAENAVAITMDFIRGL